jgi:hypothetical protein
MNEPGGHGALLLEPSQNVLEQQRRPKRGAPAFVGCAGALDILDPLAQAARAKLELIESAAHSNDFDER